MQVEILRSVSHVTHNIFYHKPGRAVGQAVSCQPFTLEGHVQPRTVHVGVVVDTV